MTYDSFERVATFDIGWASYSNEDIEDGADPDEGWYLTCEAPNGDEFEVGPDHFGPGFKTVDEALQAIEKWAKDRGCEMPSKPLVQVAVIRKVG